MRMFTLSMIHYSAFVVYLTFSEHLKHQQNSMFCFTTKKTHFSEQYVVPQARVKSKKMNTNSLQRIIHEMNS